MKVRSKLFPVAKSRRDHLMILSLAALVVFLSCSLQVIGDQRVGFAWLPAHPLPQTCFSRSIFHVPCPGCGLTRSFIYAAHGDFSSAWQMHRVGLLMALVVLAQFPYRMAALLRPDRELIDRRLMKLFGLVLIGLLITNWIYNLVSGR